MLLGCLPHAVDGSSSDLADEVKVLLDDLGLPGVTCRLRRWENPHRVHEVALWGARLAALTVPLDYPHRATIVREAAAFNLAVALFDTIVDESRRGLPLLAAALEPPLLAKRLENPEGELLVHSGSSLESAVIVRLFNYTLTSAAVRLSANPDQRCELIRLLQLMYDSEMGRARTPFLAKTLPIAFIGRLANVTGESDVPALFDELGQFIAKWDDAQDLYEDWLHGNANVYLWMPVLSPILPGIGNAVTGIARLILAHHSRTKIKHDLRCSIGRILAACANRNRVWAVTCFLRNLLSSQT